MFAATFSLFEVIDKRDGGAPDRLFLQEVAEVNNYRHSAERTLRLIVLRFFDAPLRSAAMKASEEEQVV